MVNTGTTASLGQQGGTGTVTVSGHSGGNASTWNITNRIYIGGSGGGSGTGALNILDGGVVNSSPGNIAWAPGNQGDVTVSGRDINNSASTWNVLDNIYVGVGGIGSLTVLDGAKVATTGTGPGGMAAIYLGLLPGSTGTVTVSSSTGNVSSLTATDYIDVGSQGAGTLTIEKGGFVSAGSNVYVARLASAGGALHLNGDATGRGILETGSVVKGFGVTTILDLNGGVLRANRNEANFLNGFATLNVGAGGAWFDTNAHDIGIVTDFSGSSSFNKLGLGQLTLTGDSSGFTGASTVSAGTLAVNGTLGGNMLVDTAGRLVGSGNVGNVVNTGVVAPGYGGAMGTLTALGNYHGNGGRLEIATALGGDASPTSRLVVNGATSGITQVGIINQGGLGAQTVEGIKIVDVAGASNGNFVLDGNYVFQGAPAVIAGAYAYRLYKGGASTPADGDWYLRSALSASDTPGGSLHQTVMPLYQPGVPVYEAYDSNLQAGRKPQSAQEMVVADFASSSSVTSLPRLVVPSPFHEERWGDHGEKWRYLASLCLTTFVTYWLRCVSTPVACPHLPLSGRRECLLPGNSMGSGAGQLDLIDRAYASKRGRPLPNWMAGGGTTKLSSRFWMSGQPICARLRSISRRRIDTSRCAPCRPNAATL